MLRYTQLQKSAIIMDIKSLEIYLDLSKRLHFSQTAQAMHLSASALSRTVQRLEQELKVVLLRRDNRKVSLTRAGQDFYDFALNTVNEYYLLNQKLATRRQDQTSLNGELTLFCTVTAAHIYVPKLLNTFRRRYPNADLKLITGDASQGASLVKDKKVDFAFAVDSADLTDDFVFHKVEDVECSLIAPTASATFSHLLELEPIPWQQIPFVVPESGPLTIATHDWFNKMHIKPDVYAQVTGHEAIVSMTALGCGLSIIPDPVLELSPLKQSVKTLIAPIKPSSLSLGILGLKDQLKKPLMQAFWSLATELFQN